MVNDEEIPPHWRAVLTLARTGTGTLRVHLSDAGPDAALPYVVLHPSQGMDEATSMEGSPDLQRWPFQTTVVGVDAAQALAAYQRLEDRLRNQRPVVTGRTTDRIRKTLSFPVVKDPSKQPSVFIARDTWTFTSTPA